MILFDGPYMRKHNPEKIYCVLTNLVLPRIYYQTKNMSNASVKTPVKELTFIQIKFDFSPSVDLLNS